MNAVFLDGRIGILAVAVVGVFVSVRLLVIEINVGFQIANVVPRFTPILGQSDRQREPPFVAVIKHKH